MGSRKPADYDERLRRLFEAKRRGDNDYLIEALRRERDVSTLPAKWLADQGIIEAVPALLEMLDAGDPQARWAAVAALEKLGPPTEARSRLTEMALQDDDRYVRGWSSAALGAYDDGGDEMTQLLLSVLADPDWHVSQGAAIGLGRHGDLVALGPLKARLRQLRRSPLQWYLHRLPFKEAIAALEAPVAPN
jgi:HEAT repeat protein